MIGFMSQLRYLALSALCLYVAVCKGEDDVVCAAESAQVLDCASLFPDETVLCTKCLLGYLPSTWPLNDDACTETELACAALTDCPCSECGYTFLDELNCLCSSSVTCQDTGPSAPSPVSTPVSPTKPTAQECPDESVALGKCLDSSKLDEDACTNCFLDSLPQGSSSCTEVVDTTCNAIEDCPCGTCGDELLELFNCLTFCFITCGDDDAEPTESPSPEPFLEPTAEPTAAKCPDETSALEKCIGNDIDANTCVDCFLSYKPDSIDSCTDIDDETCKAIEKCPCYACGDELLELINCLTLCFITCPFDDPSPEPTELPYMEPTPEPTKKPVKKPVAPSPVYEPPAEDPTAEPTAAKCPDESLALDECIGDNVGASACVDCFLGYWPATIDSCESIDDETCKGIQKCPCGTCGDELLEFVNCLSLCFITCPYDNPSPEPTELPYEEPTPEPTKKPSKKPVAPSPVYTPYEDPTAEPTPLECPDETDAFNECIDNDPDATTACAPCFLAALQDPFDSCTDFEDETCKAIADCPCGSCGDEILDYVNCATPCFVTCDSEKPTPKPAQKPVNEPIAPSPVYTPDVDPTAEPTALPCPDELFALAVCVDVDNLDAKDCLDCILGFWPSTTTVDSCSDFDNETCLGIEECTEYCGSCGDEVLDVINCVNFCSITC